MVLKAINGQNILQLPTENVETIIGGLKDGDRIQIDLLRGEDAINRFSIDVRF